VWRVDSSALAAPVYSQNVKENWVDADWEIINETTSKGDAWIPQHTQPYWLRNYEWNIAFVVSEIVNKTDSKGDAWIRQRAQPLLSQK
jgi:hypothetical protein